MNDQQFDEALAEKLSDLTPPEKVIRTVTPWSSAMRRILWGIALSAVSFHFLYLDLILPVSGCILMLLGFRALRRENLCFLACWRIAIVRAGYCFLATALGATVWYESAVESTPWLILRYLLLFLEILQIFFLRNGLRAVQKEAGMIPDVSGATALLLWNLVMVVLTSIQYSGWFLVLGMLAALGLILRSLRKIYLTTEQAGYAITVAPVRLPDRTLALGLCAVLLLALAAGYLFCSRYSMDWEKAEPVQSAMQEKLLALGFPEEVLSDLSKADLDKCADAAKVIVQTDSLRRRDGNCLFATGVAVQSGADARRWHVFLHYRWQDDACPAGTEAIWLNLYDTAPRRFTVDASVALSGRVLCDKGDTTYAAPFHAIEESAVVSDFFGDSYRTSLSFSYRIGAADCRSYVSYDLYADVGTPYSFAAYWGYTHQLPEIGYPVRTVSSTKTVSGSKFDTFFVAMHF